jgi:hypothetical protein
MNRGIIQAIFPEAIERMDAGKCSMGDHPIGEFRDDISREEFRISGMCQNCQDATFDEDEDDII